MVQNSADPPRGARPPLHCLLVGMLLVLWNGMGVALAIAAQSGQLPSLDPTSAAYFASQPLWFVLLADIGPFAGLAGAVALLMMHRSAVWLFIVQFAVILLANSYEVVVGSSLLLKDEGALASTLALFVMQAAQIAYARWMCKRGILA